LESGKLGNSDHVILTIEVAVKANLTNNSSQRPNWFRADYAAIQNYLNDIDWYTLLSSENVENDWQKLKNIINYCTEIYVPKSRVRDKTRPKWLNQDLIKLIRRKKAAWKEYRIQGTRETNENYKRLEGEVKKRIQRSKRRLEKELSRQDDRNGRKLTNYIKSKIKVRTGIGPLKTAEGSVTANIRNMAETLNNFFSSVFTRETLHDIPTKESETDSIVENVEITVKKIVEKIDNLRVDSAPGPDGITARFLKETKVQTSVPLKIIYEKSMDTGIIPADWKTANVCPIYKKGSRSKPGNYRPVSLTSIPCKVFEAIIKDRVMGHLMSEKLISDNQHGFMQGRSCATNLTVFLDN
jgi:Reverse transcriptase (RNA-dependent DNA polymerase)